MPVLTKKVALKPNEKAILSLVEGLDRGPSTEQLCRKMGFKTHQEAVSTVQNLVDRGLLVRYMGGYVLPEAVPPPDAELFPEEGDHIRYYSLVYEEVVTWRR